MSAIQVGDEVTWLHTSARSRIISCSTRAGTVVAISGDVATVKRGKRAVSIQVGALRRKGETTALTELVERMRAGQVAQ